MRQNIRYMYKLYQGMGMSRDFYIYEWISLTFLTFSFPVEYLISVVLVLITYPVAQQSNEFTLTIGGMAPINYSMALILMLFLSMPYSYSTIQYQCRKRAYLLRVKADRMK